jgi:Putative threonine efflux protein
LKPFKTALTISILNPKAILFYLSFFVQFVDPAYPYPAITFTALAIVLQIISMSYLTILIFSGAKLATYFSHRYKFTACCVASSWSSILWIWSKACDIYHVTTWAK